MESIIIEIAKVATPFLLAGMTLVIGYIAKLLYQVNQSLLKFRSELAADILKYYNDHETKIVVFATKHDEHGRRIHDLETTVYKKKATTQGVS